MGVKTANLAIVFTDIEGFTERTSNQTLAQNKRLLQVHAELLEPIFKAFGGRVIKSIGDAFLVTFESPTQAVLSGVAIQDKVWLHNHEAPESERFNVRVAVNVGEVRLESDDIFGEPVNIASRVEGITKAGDVYFTEAVYLAMDKIEVPSAEVGAFALKGIPDKIKIYKVPKGPHRVAAAANSEPLNHGEEEPPFGNLGVRRMPEALMKRGLAITAELGSKAVEIGADLGSRASVRASALTNEFGAHAESRLNQLLKRFKIPKPSRKILIGVGATLLLVFVLFIKIIFLNSNAGVPK